MNAPSHNDIVDSQFSPQAHAYLASAVHASGADLERMASLVGQRPEAVALDMGCGGGHATFHLAPLVGKVVACDLSEPMLRVVAGEAGRRGFGNVVTKRSAAESLPCPSASFDVAVTRYSAHHWRDVPAGLAQMRRVLKPGGMAIFMDVVTPGMPLLDTWLQSLELLRDPSHVRNASLDEWRTALATAGFAVGEVTTFRLRLEFASWVERMKTPEAHVAAIRSLQRRAGTEVRDYFAIEEDGSFTVDTMLIVGHAENR
ncbi:class I SAM-dependent methyltransferase [Pseudoduganella sp. SL102]|uniref:class I SAM-dependent methyltransferase n=1 Tax=Pseudoduganella sp. SL102 TaxID=2995154 RepID=UPI00248C68A7|nr:class I SAM-dependent methyltransferase [Pseudoduganella sp. SL102]WBS01681.1 class I SAM-dependent methyltransferase [Pseudoduganella sp. SL102]